MFVVCWLLLLCVCGVCCSLLCVVCYFVVFGVGCLSFVCCWLMLGVCEVLCVVW